MEEVYIYFFCLYDKLAATDRDFHSGFGDYL